MSEGPGQQPPQQPRDGAASDGGREVLEGLVIPSRRQPQHAAPDDPRRPYTPGQQPPGQDAAQQPGAQQSAPAPGPAWQSQQQPAPQQGQAPAQPQQGQNPQDPQAAPQGQPPQQHPQGPGAPAAGPGPQAQAAPGQHSPYGAGPGGQPPYGAAPGQPWSSPPAAPQAAAPQAQPQTQVPQAPLPQAPAGPGPVGPGAGAGHGRGGAHTAAGAPARPAAGRGRGRGGSGSGSGSPAGPAAARSGAPEAGTPDWQELASQQEAAGARRRKAMVLTGAVVVTALIAGGVATAVVVSGKSSDKTVARPSSSASGTASQAPLPPEPSFSSVAPPPPANPLDYLSSAAKDTAPITPATVFPGKQFLMDGRPYVKTATSTTAQCATGARAGLASALSANGCRELVKATYTNGGVAVTVGVAVFDDTAHAAKLKKVAQYLAPLNGGGVADFCHAVKCRMTSNTVGRYAYFAIAGTKDNKTITEKDVVALQAANDASNFAFQRIIQRGRDAAAADPSRN